MKIFSEEHIGKLIIFNSTLVGVLMWLGIVAHTFWDSKISLDVELAQLEKKYIDDKKSSVTATVQEFIQSIEVRHQISTEQLKQDLESQVEQIQEMALHLHSINKDKMSRPELEQLIVEAVRPFKLKSGRKNFFIRSLSGITKLCSADPASEGKSIYDNSNEQRLQVFNELAAIARKGHGLYEYFWLKPGGAADGQLTQAVAYVAYFAPFDWYIGAGEYLEEVEKITKQQAAAFIKQHTGRTENDEYLSILDLNSVKGGKDVASLLVNPSRPDLLNVLLSGKFQEAGGKQLRENFLAGLAEYGEVLISYNDKKPDGKAMVPKMTYFKLYSRWNWIIACSFYHDDISSQIHFKKKQNTKMFEEKLRISIAIFCFILLGALCLSLLFSHKVRTLFLAYRRRLEESNLKISKAMDRANAATEAKSEFLANMSHEIRTPMNGIINLAELIRETTLSDKQRDYIEKILLSAKSLLKIINDILDFSKIEAGMLKIEKVAFNLPELFDKLMLMFNAESSGKNIRLRLSLSSNLPEQVVGDSMRLHQILSNLIGNAVKFTDSGEITIGAAVLHQTPERVAIRFSVEDTGIGIPAEKIATLFQSFTQADSSTARKYGGTGLGLTISKQLVTLMDGDLTVESEVGRGSIFSFALEFPLHGQKKAAGSCGTSGTDEETAAAMTRICRARILLVEDNMINQQVAQELLAKADLEVMTVSNGAEAVAAVAAQDFDAVLMDVQMPVMDGYEATRRIRQELGKTDLPILAMTAHAVSGECDKCFRMGMDDHIAKPISRSALFAVLGRWIQDKSCGRPAAVLPPEQRSLTFQKDVPRKILQPPAGLDLADGLQRLEGNQQLHNKLLRSFCREQEDFAERMEAAIRAHDAKAARHLAHGLKGVVGNLGMPGLQALAGRAESELHTAGLPECGGLLRQLVKEAAAVVKYLDSRLPAEIGLNGINNSAACTADYDQQAAQLTLQRLAALVEQSDFSSLQFLEEHQDKIRPLMNGPLFIQLECCIESFRFDEALLLLKNRLNTADGSAVKS